jgi:nitronate monooxygenase
MWQKTRLTEQLGLKLPIVQGPFGGGPSTVALAVAVSEAGGLGSFGANTLGPAEIRTVVASIRARTANPFNLNLWVPQASEPRSIPAEEFAAHAARLAPYRRRLALPDPSLPARFAQSFDEQLEAALEAAPPVLSFVMGVPPRDAVFAAKSRGITLFATATTVDEARAIEEAGVDVVVASGSDAGGHRGAFLAPPAESLVGTMSLVPQVVDACRIPVVAAGGIADGRGIAAALALGAEGVQLGTAFLMCVESGASDAYRRVLESERARTTVLTAAFTGRYARGVPNELSRAFASDESALPRYPVQSWLTTPIRRAAAEAKDAELLSLWAGQAARLARRRTAVDCIGDLVSQTSATMEKLGGRSP